MSATKRVYKPQKPDNLFNPTLASDIKRARIQSAVWDYDRAITAAEAVWGVDRLPYLVDHELRLRWWRNVDALNEAITANDDQKVLKLVPNLITGIGRLIAEAEKAGERPISVEAWEVALNDGTVLRVVKTVSMGHVKNDADPRKVITWTLDEVAKMVEARSIVNEVKKTFSGATVEAVRSPFAELIDDDIPF